MIRLLMTMGVVVLSSNFAAGGLVLSYSGNALTSIVAGDAFLVSDAITSGSVTFDAIGDTTATAATFTVTTSGPGATIATYTLSADTVGELNCSCVWTGSDLTGYSFNIAGNVVDGADPEELQITDFGDGALIDVVNTSTFSHGASNLNAGTFTAVPEPSPFLFLSVAGILAAGCRLCISLFAKSRTG